MEAERDAARQVNRRDGAAGIARRVENHEVARVGGVIVNQREQPAVALACAAGDEEGLAAMLVGAGIPVVEDAGLVVERVDAALVDGVGMVARLDEPAVAIRRDR